MDTLNELAAALGDDANFSTTVNTSIAAKLPLAGGTMTGAVNFSDTGENIHSPSAGILAIESRGPIQLWGDSNNNGASTSAVLEVLRDSTYSGAAGKSTLTAYDNGDISFYEDTGTTAKFFWDASAESLGIGTTSPAQLLDIAGTAPNIRFTDTRQITWSGSEKLGGVEWFTSDTSANGTLTGASIYCENSVGSTLPNFNIVFATQVHNNSSAPIERMRVDSNGNVGIGTSSPSMELDVRNDGANGIAEIGVRGGSSGAGVVQISGNGTTYGSTSFDLIQNSSGAFVYQRANLPLILGTNATERMRIDSSGHVGIGMTPAPVGSDTVLSLYNSATPRIKLHNSTTGTTSGDGAEINMSSSDFILENREAGNVRFFNNGSERMRIDSSGTLLIGTTNGSGAGLEISKIHGVRSTVTNNVAALFDRLSSDGDIALFRKDGSTVGSIGANSNDMYIASIGTYSCGLMFEGSSGARDIRPCSSTGALLDGSVDLGDSTAKFNDLYLSAGVRASGSSIFTGSTPLEFHKGGSDTYTKTVIYDKQNDTANSTTSGITIEMAKLTNSNSAVPRNFTISNRGFSKNASFSQFGLSFNESVATAGNSLDEYEEGTWSPTLANAYNIGSLSLTEAGAYVKVGNLVHVDFDVTGSFTNAAVESRFSFTLPFNTATTSSRAVGMFAHLLTSFSNARFNNGQVFQGTTTNSQYWVYIGTNQLSGTGSFNGRVTLTYRAA